MAQIVPLTASPNQHMAVALAINGQSLTLRLSLRYNSIARLWLMDIADKYGTPVLWSIPMLTGAWPAANILAPYDYLQIGSAYIINQGGGDGDWPDSASLGSGYLLLWDDN